MSGPGPRARDAPDSAAVAGLARVGLVAYGLVHLVVAWLAVQLAWGVPGRDADQSGALAALGATAAGPVLLWVLAGGLVALAVWQGGELRWHARRWRAGGGARAVVVGTVESVGKAAVYVALAVLALRFAVDVGSPSSSGQRDLTAQALAVPGGRLAVAGVACVVAGIGVRQWVTGLRADFLAEVDLAGLPPAAARAVRGLGRVAFPAKGTALVGVGALLGWAALRVDPATSTGLDGAARWVLGLPLGRELLTVLALGVGAFGVFSLVRARSPSRT